MFSMIWLMAQKTRLLGALNRSHVIWNMVEISRGGHDIEALQDKLPDRIEKMLLSFDSPWVFGPFRGWRFTWPGSIM